MVFFSRDYFRVMKSVAAESIISGGLRNISEKKLVCCDPVHSRRLWSKGLKKVDYSQFIEVKMSHCKWKI